jgi:hypothetical protein
MSSISIALIACACVFGAALLGLLLQTVLPRNHFQADTKDVVKLGMGLVGTMAALVLGLLVASAKGSYDAQSTELTDLAANVIVLDRVLAHYGPESKDAREQLRGAVVTMLTQLWSREPGSFSQGGTASSGGELIYAKIQRLSARDDAQRSLQAQALSMALGLAKTRWLMYEQNAVGVSLPLLVVLISWLAMIFTSFGLFAPRNGTVLVSLFVSALSVSGAILLILEMYTPYAGLIQISQAPLRAALAHLGQ